MYKLPESKSFLFAGASVVALSLLSPVAFAQEEPAAAESDGPRIATVTVTTQKQAQDIQDVPIAVSAFDESAVERLQLTGGPDLVKAIPNVNFTKGNFAGFNFKIRGVGVDVIAQSGDAGVGVHQNDVPLTANRLFEAEFYDVERVEVLRGPQGTLYGRNATGGVFNLITAKPVFDEFQASGELGYGNHNTIRGKGMVNIPIVDGMALRVAGSYLTRDGYVKNVVTGNDIDDRDLWSVRATLGLEPTDKLRGWVSYEHFEEDDSRARVGKQLCKKDTGRTTFAGIAVSAADQLATSLGCRDVPLSQMDGRVNSAATLGGGLAITAGLLNGDAFTQPVIADLRTIESAFDPIYQAEQTLVTWKAEYDLLDNVKVSYLGSYNENKGVSIEDYNKIAPTTRFNAAGVPLGNTALAPVYAALFPNGVVNDPQLGSSNLFRTFDLSGGESTGSTHEFRVQSDNDGFFNFNLGYIKVDNESIDPRDNQSGYYVFSNSLTALTQLNNAIGGGIFGGVVPLDNAGTQPSLFNGNLGGNGGNYFRSLSPYRLDSYALFGEGYFQLSDSLKFTLGLRQTNDSKEQDNIPTFLFTPTVAIPGGDPLRPRPAAATDQNGTLKANFEELTGRAGLDWKPELGFTDDTLVYAFYSKGYKGGGLNPPLPAGTTGISQTFEPEFVNAWEIGTKNTFADGSQQLNLSAFKYDYQGYQVTQIVNRSSVNINIDAEIQGVEAEYLWAPTDKWLFSTNLGFLDSSVVDTYGIDVMDRGNSRSDIVVLKNASSFANCAVSAAGYAAVLGAIATPGSGVAPGTTRGICTLTAAQRTGLETALGLAGRTINYTDTTGATRTASLLEAFDGDAKNLDGNGMTGAPEITASVAAEYTFDFLSNSGWDFTVRGDVYYQGESWSRIWNTARDRLDAWHNVNLSGRLHNEDSGWSVEAFAKNLTDEEVITGAYLTDDSSGLFTNIFLTEPALYGVSVKKTF